MNSISAPSSFTLGELDVVPGMEKLLWEEGRKRGQGSVAKVLPLSSGKPKQQVQPCMSSPACLVGCDQVLGKGLHAGVMSGGKAGSIGSEQCCICCMVMEERRI